MIKFFRKIRQKLLEQNRVSKYLLYAFGEIILVVIGILIALQINNNNEAKKDRAFELKMLKEISKSLDRDINYIENHLIGYRTKEGEKSVAYFKRLYKKEPVDLDSLKKYFYWLNNGVILQINQGPYQGLKSVGLDKISNDTLRNKIQSLYDFDIPRRIELVVSSEEEMEVLQTPLQNMFLRETKYEVRNDTVKFITSLESGKFWETPNFIKLVSMSDQRLSYRKRSLSSFANILKYAKKLIDSEIEVLSN